MNFDRRRMMLPTDAGPVTVLVEHLFHGGEIHGNVQYIGTIEALLASGALTTRMLEIRAAFRRGDPGGLHDDAGKSFGLHTVRRRTQALMCLRRREAPMYLPGMRELFPAGPPVAPGTSGAPRFVRPQLRLVIDNTREVTP